MVRSFSLDLEAQKLRQARDRPTGPLCDCMVGIGQTVAFNNEKESIAKESGAGLLIIESGRKRFMSAN